MKGGPSHVDTFDPKPLLDRDHGKPYPGEKPRVAFAKTGNLLKSPWKFKQYGQSGIAGQRAVPARGPVRRRPLLHPLAARHQPGPRRGGAEAAHRQRQLRPPEHGGVGRLRPGHREPEPARRSSPSARRWPTAASTTGARRSCRPPARGCRSATPASRSSRRRSATSTTRACRATCSGSSSTCWPRLNREHLARTGPDLALEGRIESFELAFRMQTADAGGRGPLAASPRRRKKLYGLDDPVTGQLRPAVPAGPAVRRARRALRPGHAQRRTCSGTSTAT